MLTRIFKYCFIFMTFFSEKCLIIWEKNLKYVTIAYFLRL